MADAVLNPLPPAARSAAQEASSSAAAAVAAPSCDAGDGLCGLCHDPLEDSVTAACKHSFCRACVSEYLQALGGQAAKCPTCSKPLTVDLTQGAAGAFRLQLVIFAAAAAGIK